MNSKFILFAFVFFTSIACKKEDVVKVNHESYPLPGDQLFPEGIAYNPKAGVFYTGSTSNGDIIKVNVETAEATLFASGAKQGRTFCTGMKLDQKNRLWVCGGSQGLIQVLSPTGELIKSWDTKALFNSGFVNDCIIGEKYIYFTDSQVKKLYRAGASAALPGDLEVWSTLDQVPYSAGTNANGIDMTADGKYLIIVMSNSGKIYKINTANKDASEILLNTPVPSGDGLWLDGRTLYVSRNATGLIFPVEINSDYTQGLVGAGFGNNLITNTTIAKAGKYFLVVNAKFSRRANPLLPFSVSRVPIP